jgi:transposase-like protein
MVLGLRWGIPGDHGVIARVARQLHVGPKSLRIWVKQTEVDAGAAPPRLPATSRRSWRGFAER